MSSKRTVIKNLCWAFAIVICLLALVVGFIISSVNRYSGESFSGTADIKSESAEENEDIIELAPGDGSGTARLKLLPETKDAGQEYIDSLTFLCDSSFIGVRDYGLLSGGTGTYQVWGTETGSFKVSDLSSGNIKYPADGSSITVADAAMIAKPPILVICVGQDGLKDVNEATFKTCYSALIQSIQASSPETTIICCGITSVVSNYTGVDGLTPVMISDANDWIMDVCSMMNIYYSESAKAVGDGTGSVLSSYLSSNGKTLNSGGINEILTYLRTHAVGVE
ncbi:MAG: SGNH/GDSL hydrolase family protein [Candidatus Limivicinus sp.]|jgi:hypothetical protein